MDIEDLLGRSPLDAFVLLEAGERMFIFKVGSAHTLECRGDGFLFSTAAALGALRQYSVIIKAT
jgi:hypothetical protein